MRQSRVSPQGPFLPAGAYFPGTAQPQTALPNVKAHEAWANVTLSPAQTEVTSPTSFCTLKHGGEQGAATVAAAEHGSTRLLPLWTPVLTMGSRWAGPVTGSLTFRPDQPCFKALPLMSSGSY